MAIVRNRTLSDGGTASCFEVVGSGDLTDENIVTVSTLSGAGDEDNQSIIVKRVVATVVNTDPTTGSLVTLSWGDGMDFLHLPPGVVDLDIPFEHNTAGGGDADILLTATANTSFTIRLYTNKVSGFPLSMGHARNRP